MNIRSQGILLVAVLIVVGALWFGLPGQGDRVTRKATAACTRNPHIMTTLREGTFND
jgi:hypothetical protein